MPNIVRLAAAKVRGLGIIAPNSINLPKVAEKGWPGRLVVGPPRRRWHADLPGNGLNHGDGHVAGVVREAAIGLEQL